MKKALIIGASGGIGVAIKDALEDRGVAVTGLSRSVDGLDVTDETSVARAFEALDPGYELILVATGALEIDGARPEKALAQLDPQALMDQFRLNSVGPALVLKHGVRLLPTNRPATFAALSARVGSIGDNRLGGWYSYRTAKAALNQLIHSAAIELARTHKQLACVALHPGTVQTEFTRKYLGRHPSVPAAEAAANLLAVIDGLTPEQTGRFYDWAGKEIPVVSRLVLVLGDQLTPDIAALMRADKASDVVVMAEVRTEASYVRHHPKKIAFIFSAMRKFATALREDGWQVRYAQYDDTDNAGSIPAELLRRAEETGASEVLATEPGEWRLIDALADMPLKLTLMEDDRFLASHAEFDAWAEGRKSLRMEYFYREMRRKTGLLMDGDKPSGGKWNFDHDNRKPAPEDVGYSGPMQFTPDTTVSDVLALVEAEFSENFGDLYPFQLATDREQARRVLTRFVKHALPRFGDYQDAMLVETPFLYHAVISPYLNVGLLSPLEVCAAAEQAWRAGDVPINAAEGFIRQIIGWREYVRGIYFLEGRDYPRRNALNHQRGLPALYWGAETRMRCLSQAVAQTRQEAYAHHIQRLMVTGNFGLLAGVNPTELHQWYLEVYADAFEWVEAPNTVGMSQFADGGIIASKPYVSSGAYINRMSDYCGACHYKVKQKTGEGACPFNLLYWHFLDRHRDRFEKNPRMGNMYRTWDRMDPDRRETVLVEAGTFLERLSRGETV